MPLSSFQRLTQQYLLYKVCPNKQPSHTQRQTVLFVLYHFVIASIPQEGNLLPTHTTLSKKKNLLPLNAISLIQPMDHWVM
uniref:Uncharacterized protein n=1 Tax=Pyxicephalus adspersus TaxID=30357 RepID=A0AAV2ZJ90_PYXAD|nr:TPA: hypothetical protein GDO54_005081 [Pyxicephalus adspersus]